MRNLAIQHSSESFHRVWIIAHYRRYNHVTRSSVFVPEGAESCPSISDSALRHLDVRTI